MRLGVCWRSSKGFVVSVYVIVSKILYAAHPVPVLAGLVAPADLRLELINVGKEARAAFLEQQVLVREPRAITQTNELEHLGELGISCGARQGSACAWDGVAAAATVACGGTHERQVVDRADDRVDDDEAQNRTTGVEQELGLVLDALPLLADGVDDLIGVDAGVGLGRDAAHRAARSLRERTGSSSTDGMRCQAHCHARRRRGSGSASSDREAKRTFLFHATFLLFAATLLVEEPAFLMATTLRAEVPRTVFVLEAICMMMA